MSMSALEEQLRESACYGDQDAMTSLLQAGVNVNSANSINGWTALHWACKRGHVKCKKVLLSWGADTDILNQNGATPLSLEPTSNQLSNNSSSHESNSDASANKSQNDEQHRNSNHENEGFVPNYLQHPEFCHKVDVTRTMGDNVQTEHETARQNGVPRFKRDTVSPDQHKDTTNDGDNVEFQNQKLYQKGRMTIIKARLMKPDTLNMQYVSSHTPGLDESFQKIKMAKPQSVFLLENDFIEIDIPFDEMTMSGITRLVLEEFQLTHQINIDVHNVYVRKLPNTRLRKDVEIARLKEYEEIEIGFMNYPKCGDNSCQNRKGSDYAEIESNEK